MQESIGFDRRADGPLIAAVVDGAVALPWLDRGLRTCLRLHSGGGNSDLSLAWLAGGLLDVSAGEGRPPPVVLPVAPLAPGGSVALCVLPQTNVDAAAFGH